MRKVQRQWFKFHYVCPVCLVPTTAHYPEEKLIQYEHDRREAEAGELICEHCLFTVGDWPPVEADAEVNDHEIS